MKMADNHLTVSPRLFSPFFKASFNALLLSNSSAVFAINGLGSGNEYSLISIATSILSNHLRRRLIVCFLPFSFADHPLHT